MSNTKPTGTGKGTGASPVSLVKDANKPAPAPKAASAISGPKTVTPKATAAKATPQKAATKASTPATKATPKTSAPAKKTAATAKPKAAPAKPKTAAAKPAKKVTAKKATTKKPAAPKKPARAATKPRSLQKKVATKVSPKAKATTASSRKAATPAASTNNFVESFADNGEFVKIYSDYGNATVDAAKAMSLEYLQYMNDSFVENMELSKDLFHCRTVDDAIELHDRAVRSYMDSFFNQTTRFSDMFLEYTANATEPFNESIEATSKKLEKAFAG